MKYIGLAIRRKLVHEHQTYQNENSLSFVSHDISYCRPKQFVIKRLKCQSFPLFSFHIDWIIFNVRMTNYCLYWIAKLNIWYLDLLIRLSDFKAYYVICFKGRPLWLIWTWFDPYIPIFVKDFNYDVDV